MLRLLDTFSGIGGFSYAAERLVGGYQTVQFVERELFCQSILRKHWPNVPIHDDICTYNPKPGSVDVVCGGFPCQDIPTATTLNPQPRKVTAGGREYLIVNGYRVPLSPRPETIPDLLPRELTISKPLA